MSKRGMHVIISTVLLIALAALLGAIFIKWIVPYARESTEDIDEQKEEIETNAEAKISIRSVNVNDIGLDILVENKGRLPVVELLIRTTIPSGAKDSSGNAIPGGIYSRAYPFDETEFELSFFEKETVTIWYPEIHSDLYEAGALENYEKIEIIPTVRLDDGTEKQIGDAGDTWHK